MTNQEQLGRIGEQLVANFLGLDVNKNFYDSRKDFCLPNGEIVEVKTQNRHPSKPMLTIGGVNNGYGLNNVLKCCTVDRLIFVEYDHSNSIKLWECVNRKNYEIYTTRQGKVMIGWPIADMQLLTIIEDHNIAASMRNLSQSRAFK